MYGDCRIKMMKSGSTQALLFALAVLSAVAFGAAAVATASEHYSVTSAGSVDVPDRTVTLGGQEFNIESVGHVTPGETVEATTEAPEEKEYILYLYDNQVTRVDFSRMTGNDSASFPTDGLEPGTYVLVVRADREFKTIHPVVVAGYEPTVDTPGAVTPSESFTVEIDPDAEKYEDAPDMDSITVVRTEDGEAVEEVEATPVEGSDNYEAELTAPDEEGDVRLLTSVFGEESIAYTSEQEILALTNTTLTESAFEVAIDEGASTAEVSENETVEIVANVENTGDFTGDATVELSHDGDPVDDVTVSLNGSESAVATLTDDADNIDPGELEYTVSSADSTDTLNVTITESTDGTGGEDASESPENGAGGDDETPEGEATNGSSDGAGTDTEKVDNGTSTGNTDTGAAGNGTDDGDGPENGTDIDSSESASGGTETTDGDSTSGDGQTSDSSNDTDDGAIEPNDQVASSDSVPLTGVPQFLAAVLTIGVLARSRSR
ncbi:hypothetical protein [Halorubrum miltondacostae]|uniref:CARDB domain-containing protein n=1 Tax=Halorubrum miltondacostae TaxID=3076378 RepID=A0ABD5M3F1_9EURY